MTAREVRFAPLLRNKVNQRAPVQGRCSSKFLKLRQVGESWNTKFGRQG